MRINQIEAAVRQAVQPRSLSVIDESHLHRGHAGARPYGQSHFKVIAVSNAFAGKNRVQRQQMVYRALGDAVGNEIHALSMTLQTPEEAG